MPISTRDWSNSPKAHHPKNRGVSFRSFFSPSRLPLPFPSNCGKAPQVTVPARLFAQHDANFNVTAITNTGGTVQERYTPDPFGVVTFRDASGNTISASAKDWVFLHQGGQADILGHYDFRNRILSPTLGRWLTNDPLGFDAGDNNFYGYLANGPGNGLDPSGRQKYLSDPPPAGDYPTWGGSTLDPNDWPIWIVPYPGIITPIPFDPFPSAGNCWNYACNDPDRKRGHTDPCPPAIATPKVRQWTCEYMIDKILAKFNPMIQKMPKSGKCPPGSYQIRGYVMTKPVIVDSKFGRKEIYSYHWIRQNPDGTWSDKRGYWPVTPKIFDPDKRAGDMGYDKVCEPLCVSGGGQKWNI